MRREGRAGAMAALLVAAAPAALLLAPAPVAAQFSDSYNFLKAVKDKDGGKATELLDKPGNTLVNTRDLDSGETALHMVTRRGDLAWVGFLLGKGANANLKDRDGNTPLMLATVARWTEGVNLFVKIKAQLDAQNRLGETALLKAVQARDAATAKQLLDAGANPDIADNSGVTPRAAAANDPRLAAVAKQIKDVPVRGARTVQGPSL